MILGSHLLWRDAASRGPKTEAYKESQEQKWWDHMISDGWLPESKCRPGADEEALAALTDYTAQWRAGELALVRIDEDRKRHNC